VINRIRLNEVPLPDLPKNLLGREPDKCLTLHWRKVLSTAAQNQVFMGELDTESKSPRTTIVEIVVHLKSLLPLAITSFAASPLSAIDPAIHASAQC
jgi:hypothetical protein